MWSGTGINYDVALELPSQTGAAMSNKTEISKERHCTDAYSTARRTSSGTGDVKGQLLHGQLLIQEQWALQNY